MTGFDVGQARGALAELPEETSYGEPPPLANVYLPAAHLKALSPDVQLVAGMRGAGKTFWWNGLQQPSVRQLVHAVAPNPPLDANTEIRTGFGVLPAPDQYPDKDTLRALISDNFEPRLIWRTVQAWQLAETGDPIRRKKTWKERVDHVFREPEKIANLFHECDAKFNEKGSYLLILFDALDLCADDWKDMYRLIRGLMQTALEMRSYKRLRVKIFLRSDQIAETKIADFPDASKVLASRVELSWPARELYGLLWHHLANGDHGDLFRTFLWGGDCPSAKIAEKQVFLVQRDFVSREDPQRGKFHALAGDWMGRDRRRGFPYTWIPNHLADTEGRVSPRSFLMALRTAAEDTEERHPGHEFALHYDSIKSGVRQASARRVDEIREDYPWVNGVFEPLAGLSVPCRFEEIETRWDKSMIIAGLTKEAADGDVKLPPRHIDQGAEGVRQELESLGIFRRLSDGRVNIPDVFRVGYGLGRKGGVKPAQ